MGGVSYPQRLSTKPARPRRLSGIIVLVIAAALAAGVFPAGASPVGASPAGASAGPVSSLWAAAAAVPAVPEEPLGEVERLLEGLQRQLGADLPSPDLRDLVRMLQGDGDGLDFSAIGRALASYFARELVANARLLSHLLALVVLLGVLLALRSSFGDESVAAAAHLAGCVVLAGLATAGLRMAIEAARDHVTLTADFMRAMLPVLLSLLIGAGSVVSAGLFSPWLLFSTYAVATLASGVVIPLAMVSAACEVASSLGTRVRITGVASLLRQVAVTLLGLSLTVFLGVMTVQSAAGSVADGVALRTSKFLASSFIPVVGKMFGDAMEMVVGGSLVLKNAVGIAGGIAVFAMTALPALQIGALILVYRVAAALAQPVADRQVLSCLEGIASCLSVVLLAVAAVGLAWFVSLVMLVGAGNAAVMFR